MERSGLRRERSGAGAARESRRTPLASAQRPARRRALLASVGLLGVLAAGCDAWLGARGARTFAELSAAEAAGELAGGAAVLVQVRELDQPATRLADAALLEPEAPVPDAWREAGARIVVVASQPGNARRLAARLVRAGVPRVAVLRGGIQAWLAEAPGRTPSAAKQPASESRDT